MIDFIINVFDNGVELGEWFFLICVSLYLWIVGYGAWITFGALRNYFNNKNK